MQAAGASGKVRFGPYELDPARLELRKFGLRLRLSRQPFQVLAALLEAQGEVVTRDALRARLWPQNHFGDFDHGLNVAVKKLRDALGDSADNPRYVATVDRQGYRFIAPTALVTGEQEDEEANGEAAAPPRSVREVLIAEPAAARVAIADPVSRAPRPAMGLVSIAIVIALVVVPLVWRLPSATPQVVRSVQLTHSGLVHPNQKLLTDGPRVYFIERDGGRWVGKWTLASGGAVTALQIPFELYDFQDISADGSELIVREFRGFDLKDLWVWAAPTVGGAPRVVGAGIESAAFSADGASLLYSTASTIYGSNPHAPSPQKLIDAPGEVVSLAPHDGVIRFAVQKPSEPGVSMWDAKQDGSGVHRVLPDWHEAAPEWGGSWSPDGRWYAFSAARNGTHDLWLLANAPGAKPVQLTSGPLEYRTPIFSRDGKRIFCVGLLRRGEMLRFNPATKRFAPMLGGISAEQVEYSHDRQWLVYVTYPEGALWRARADGGERRQLTAGSMHVFGPHWSPDDSQIIFEARDTVAASWTLRVMPSAGGALRQFAAAVGPGGATWSPDGKSVVIGDASASRLHMLDIERGTLVDVPGSEGLTYPAMSPRGTLVAAVTQPGEVLVVFDPAKHTRRELARNAQYAVWSRDEQYIYFNSFTGSQPTMYRVRVTDGKIETVFHLDEFTPAGSWGVWSTLVPDGSILLMRDTGTVDLYGVDWQPR